MDLDEYERMFNKVLFADHYTGPTLKEALTTQKEWRNTSNKPQRAKTARKAKPYPFPRPEKELLPWQTIKDPSTARNWRNSMALTQTMNSGWDYKGPRISGYNPERKFMQTVSNHAAGSAHTSSTNNGYARKQSGGFYYH